MLKPFSPWSIVLRMAVPIAAMGAMTATAGDAAGQAPPAQRRSAAAVGAKLPALTLPDLDGASQPLRRGSNEVTIVNFWATWCVPCLKEIPELATLAQNTSDHGVTVVGIAIDSGEPAAIRTFATGHRMDYTLLVGTQGWAREHFGVFGLPVTLIVDRSGHIRQRLVGPQTGESLAAAVRPYL